MASIIKNARKKCAITMADKMEIVRMFEKGQSYASIARQTKRPQSTIRTIIKSKETLLNSAKGTSMATRKRNEVVEKMESLLVVWIEDMISKRIPLSLGLIQSKAKSLYEDLDGSTTKKSVCSFNASLGWFNRFKKTRESNVMKM